MGVEAAGFRSSARVNLVVLGAAAAPGSPASSALAAAGPQDVPTVMLLAPRAAAGMSPWLQRAVAGPLWDAREHWDQAAGWHALGQRLATLGRAAEVDVDVHNCLVAGQLQHDTIRSYDHIAEAFAERWFEHPPMRELERFLRRLRPKSRILDAGCGPGHHARLLAHGGHEVVAIDLSEGMLDQARKRVQTARFIKMDLQTLSFGAATFDAIWCAAAILHVPREQLAAVLRRFRRVLKPGGLLGLNFQIGRPSELVQRGQDRRFFEYHADARPVSAALAGAGFGVEASLYGETARNTHGLDITLKWRTLYASALSRDGAVAGVAVEDRPAQIEFGLGPCEEVDLLDLRS